MVRCTSVKSAPSSSLAYYSLLPIFAYMKNMELFSTGISLFNFLESYKCINMFPVSDLWDALPQAGGALPAGGGGGHSGGGLHDCGGHVGHSQRCGGGGVRGQDRERVPDQTQVPLHPHAGIVFRRQFEHLEAVVIQPRDLTLEGPTLVLTANFNGCLAVKDGQLSP